MTFTCSALQWPLWDWTTSVASGPGARLAEAFNSFAAVVNTTQANSGVPLSIVKDHSAATGPTTYGYVWRLGHPVNPVLLSFSNTSKVQGYSSSSSSAKLLLGLESAYTNDSSNAGYGSFSGTLANINAGMSHYASNGTPNWDLAGFLLVLADTTPGQEFFCYTIAPIGSTTNAQNHTLLLFRSAAVSGWSVLFNRSDSYGSLFHSQDIYTWSNNQLVAATLMPPQPSGNEQQLIRGFGLYVAASSSGLFTHGTIQQRVNVPPHFWLGSNQLTDVRRLGRVTNPGGYPPGGTGSFYQLGAAASGACDIWYLHPAGITPMAGWISIGSLPWSTGTDRLSFCPLHTLQPLALGPSSAPNFLTDWSMAALGGAWSAAAPVLCPAIGQWRKQQAIHWCAVAAKELLTHALNRGLQGSTFSSPTLAITRSRREQALGRICMEAALVDGVVGWHLFVLFCIVGRECLALGDSQTASV